MLLLALCIAAATAATAAPTFPALTGRVVDEAGILAPQQVADLTAKLKALEDKTKTQLVVVTLKSLQGYDIADYGYQLGRHWGIGQKGANNGALLIVAPNERKVRIEVGYGLEGTLTDAFTKLVIENAIIPRFRAGDMPGGVERGTEDLVQILEGDTETYQKLAEQRDEEGSGDWVIILVIIGVYLLFVILANRGRRGRSWVWTSGGAAGGSSWGRGGSWGGSSGGGFSGGGGSFGGGGSSGSW